MAKTYIDMVKYMVEAKFSISGAVEKPDIIGAVFGQTEGLLGADLDLRELQKNGKIGRIEINANTVNGKTSGKLILPSSLGRIETCILAAGIESVNKVGPFEIIFNIIKVEDTRNEKRNKVINRAKELVKKMLSTTVPDSREISDLVEADVKSSTVQLYGEEKLPSGPDIAKSESMIIVEGRADVINLLKNDITNCISIGGASGEIPKTVLELCKQKDVTVFLDGDRGGSIILNGLINAEADMDFVTRAPDGKEVEELTRKEIIKSLRYKVPIDQIISNKNKIDPGPGRWRNNNMHYNTNQTSTRYKNTNYNKSSGKQSADEISSPTQIVNRMRESNSNSKESELYVKKTNVLYNIKNIDDSESRKMSEVEAIDFADSDTTDFSEQNKEYVKALDELKNTLRGRLYSKSGDLITEMPIRDLIHTIEDTPNSEVVVFDGIITQRLVDVANRNNIKVIYGIRSSDISRKYKNIHLFTSGNGII